MGGGPEVIGEGGHLLFGEERRVPSRLLKVPFDFPQASPRPFPLLGVRYLGGLTIHQFSRFGLNVPKVALKVFVDGAGAAKPLGAAICGRAEPVIGPSKKILPKRNFYQCGLVGSAGIALAGRTCDVRVHRVLRGLRQNVSPSSPSLRRKVFYTMDEESVYGSGWGPTRKDPLWCFLVAPRVI